MKNAYHNVLFVSGEGISDQQVVDTFNKFRDLGISKGYIGSKNDFSLGKAILPDGAADEAVAKARKRTGGFNWGLSIRLDGVEALQKYLQMSGPDIKEAGVFGLFTDPPQLIAHDHIDQSQ